MNRYKVLLVGSYEGTDSLLVNREQVRETYHGEKL